MAAMSDDSGLSAHLTTLLDRLDWVSGIGAAALRVAAVVGSAAAVACFVVFARHWGGFGILLLILGFLPAAALWFYARSLDGAVDAAKLELAIGDLAGKAIERVGDVQTDLKTAGRMKFVRAGWTALRSVRELREEVATFGVDLAAWTAVASPLMLTVVGFSLLGVVGLLLALAVGGAAVAFL